MPGDKPDIERLHQDADLKATGFDAAKSIADGFKVGGLMPLMKVRGENITHSIGIRPHPHGGAIAKSLLGVDKVETVQIDETRPLIDLLQEATFGDAVPMQWVADKYALRALLRKAHCFRLDAETSAMVTDFGIAIARDLEAVRHLAIPPFPITWFEIDNIARLNRSKERGLQLTETASRSDVCTRVGWLIHPAADLHSEGYYATYCTVIGQGVMIAPLSFFWHPGESAKDRDPEALLASDFDIKRCCFGVPDPGVHKLDAFPACTPFHLYYERVQRHSNDIVGLMLELSGELRSIWGLLLALGAGQLGAVTSTAAQALPTGPAPIAKGKPVLPLEHKILTIKLAKRATVEKVALKAITGIKKRWHDVRSHFRTKLNPDGSVKWRIAIKSHTRGDERLGRIEKTYRVEK